MKTPQLLPLSMARYGLNAYGEPLYRVAFSDSRTYLAGGKWPDGACEYREVEFYPGIHAWMLEKFQTSEEYAGKREEYNQRQWDAASGLLTLGPYPEKGEWVHCYTFPFEPTDSMISVLVRGIAASRNLTPGERKDSIMAPLLARKKRANQRIDDVFEDSQNAFRFADAMVSMANPGNKQLPRTRRRNDVNFKLGAEDLGMPMSDNAFFTGEEYGHSHSNARPSAPSR